MARPRSPSAFVRCRQGQGWRRRARCRNSARWFLSASSPPSPLSSPLSLLSSPRRRRVVRGKSGIAEFQLVAGDVELSLAWVDGWRLVDFSERTTQEQTLTDELGEAERGDGKSMQAGGDAQQEITNHGGEELQRDCIFVFAERSR